MSHRSAHDSRQRSDLDLRKEHNGSKSGLNRSTSFADELFSDGSASYDQRPPSPGLPLHRDPGMSNLELHDTAAGVSSRRRGNGTAINGGSPAMGTHSTSSTFVQDDNDYTNEKDYLMDRDHTTRNSPPLASTSKATLFNTKEKEKWSKLIPEDIIGGSSSLRARRPGSRQRRSGLSGVVSLEVH